MSLVWRISHVRARFRIIRIFGGGVRFGTGRNFDYSPAFSFCRDTWPCRCCPWPLLRRPGTAQTGTFDVPATDVSIFWDPTHGRYPGITNIRLWGLDRALMPYNKIISIWTNLKDDIAEAIIGEITTIEEWEVESIVGLPRHWQAHVQTLLDLTNLGTLKWLYLSTNITENTMTFHLVWFCWDNFFWTEMLAIPPCQKNRREGPWEAVDIWWSCNWFSVQMSIIHGNPKKHFFSAVTIAVTDYEDNIYDQQIGLHSSKCIVINWWMAQV